MNDQEEQLKKEVEFSQEARKVLNNKAYQEAITLRKAQIFETFCNTAKNQEDVREEAWRTMKNINALEDYFKVLLDTGKMAQTTLDSQKKEE